MHGSFIITHLARSPSTQSAGPTARPEGLPPGGSLSHVSLRGVPPRVGGACMSHGTILLCEWILGGSRDARGSGWKGEGRAAGSGEGGGTRALGPRRLGTCWWLQGLLRCDHVSPASPLWQGSSVAPEPGNVQFTRGSSAHMGTWWPVVKRQSLLRPRGRPGAVFARRAVV